MKIIHLLVSVVKNVYIYINLKKNFFNIIQNYGVRNPTKHFLANIQVLKNNLNHDHHPETSHHPVNDHPVTDRLRESYFPYQINTQRSEK